MLTTKKIYSISEGRVHSSSNSGISAPDSLGDFFISDLLRECREYNTSFDEIISDDYYRPVSSRNLNGFSTSSEKEVDMKKVLDNPNNIKYSNLTKKIRAVVAPESKAIFLYLNLGDENRKYTEYRSSQSRIGLVESPTCSFSGGKLKDTRYKMNNLTFNNQHIDLINVNGQPYMTQTQIGLALKYANTSKVSNLFNAHKDEFTPEMSMLIKQGRTQVRVFSLRGCHLLAMFSKTQVAKDFRKWVLDLIESHNQAISKMETTGFDMKAIGGLVKKCCAVAVKEELERQAMSPMLPFAGQSDEAIKNLVSALLTNIINGRVENQVSEIIAENKELKEKVNQIKSIANTKALIRRAA